MFELIALIPSWPTELRLSSAWRVWRSTDTNRFVLFHRWMHQIILQWISIRKWFVLGQTDANSHLERLLMGRLIDSFESVGYFNCNQNEGNSLWILSDDSFFRFLFLFLFFVFFFLFQKNQTGHPSSIINLHRFESGNYFNGDSFRFPLEKLNGGKIISV